MIAADSETAAQAERELRAALSTAHTQIEQLRLHAADTSRRHRDDIALIGERLIAEADDRRWRKAYDDIVDELNTDPNVEPPVRQRDFTVTAFLDLRMSVTAPNEHDARERAGEQPHHTKSRLDARASITAGPQDSRDWDVWHYD